MKRMCFYLFFLFSFVVLPNHLFAQEKIDLTTLRPSNEWNKYKELESVDIYYQYTNCNLIDGFSFKYVFFKIINKTKQKIQISWEFELENDGQLVALSPDDLKVKCSIDAGCQLEGNCQEESLNMLKLFVAETESSVFINGITIKDIVVSTN